jgi:uncharacterized protein YeaO (DUF488 family)
MADMSQGKVRVRRVYDSPESSDGARVLVDRLWPRGLSKADAQLTEWCKDVAPSAELRRWYDHREERYEEFAARYQEELAAPRARAALDGLRKMAADGPLTLLTATKEPEYSHASVLLDGLSEGS